MRRPSPNARLLFGLALLLASAASAHAQGRGGGAGGGRDVSAIVDRALSRRAMPEAAMRGLERAEAARSAAAERAIAAADRVNGRSALVRKRLVEDRRRPIPVLSTDRAGRLVVRNEVIALDASAESLAAARQAGFSVLRRTNFGPLDLDLTVLAAPPGMATDRAVELLRERDPSGNYDFNHLYDGAAAAAQGEPTASGRRSNASVGMIDGGVDPRAEALRGVQVEQRSFVGQTNPQPHGSAVASILANPGTGGGVGRLRVADVYGASPTGGSAEAIVAGMAWLAESRTPVINVSLVGPPNALLGAAVRSLVAKGFLIVAPAGNDGPASKDTYPASYPGVIAVSAVDPRGRLLPEAGQPAHIDFVALGLVTPPGTARAAPMRGTSFAAPVVSARLADLIERPDPSAAQRAVASLARTARDLGPKGKDARYGHGWVQAAN